MRKAYGLAALQQRQQTSSQYTTHGSNLRNSQTSALQTQLELFKATLQHFSQTRSKEILADPKFRAEFLGICQSLGLDPLLGSTDRSGRGIFSGVSGNVGGSSGSMKEVSDFWMQISMRIVELCRSSRAIDGGLRSLESLRKEIATRSGKDVSLEDCTLAISLLSPLGSGFSILKLGGIDFVRSIPADLSNDQTVVLEAITVAGFVSVVILRVNLRWDKVRALTVLEDLEKAGLVWVDKQADQGPNYYSGNLITGSLQ